MTEHDDVIRLLREGRPQATEMELDAIKQRVRRRAAARSRRSQSMKSRVAILGMLVTGMVFSTAGAGLALSGTSHNQASVAQYETATPTYVCTPGSDVSPSEQGQSPECTPTPEGGVLPAETESPGKSSGGGSSPKPAGGVQPTQASETQPTRQQAAATGSQLPFTGFAAVPVLLGGLALLTGGLVLRRRTRSDD
jgi:hypothetical protein